MKIAVLGAGAWGTALAIHLAWRHAVVLWARNPEHAEAMRMARANQRYLGDFPFPDALQLESDLHRALQGADLILSVVPTSGVRAMMREIRAARCMAPVVWANKGLERDTALLLHEIAEEELPFGQAWGILSGPSFASDLAKGLPTAMTLASIDSDFAQEAASSMHAGSVRVYSSQDVIGVAVGGALKNVMAIAAGICDGMAFGANARAALITRGLAEITRFGLAVGGRGQTFMGLAGAGDLILTCTGDSSRNRTVGLRLARGETLQQIVSSLGHVAEGVHTTREVHYRARQLGVEMPITNEVNRVLSEGLPPREAVENLLNREQKAEH
ncbi:glycerol-3-phosphate dehydrogenase [mine drainage metagenome]|uniref:Glycerol-3-phosphate dehydrogenase n=1 Tax=mine drainage metagenome TaxID=410659 RepID=A0A1J5R8R5_9ZZZZ